ncbi:MAG: ArsR/SmtB family transcription factor [Acidobacteriota bacterium]
MVTYRGGAASNAVFRAIAEPTRRGLLDELSRGSRTAGALARRFPSSRPAVARHLRVLRQAGLVRARRDGRKRIYELRPRRLKAVRTWIDRYEVFWSERLDELARYVERRDEEGRRRP